MLVQPIRDEPEGVGYSARCAWINVQTAERKEDTLTRTITLVTMLRDLPHDP